jgi:hypothetical protein
MDRNTAKDLFSFTFNIFSIPTFFASLRDAVRFTILAGCGSVLEMRIILSGLAGLYKSFGQSPPLSLDK